MELRQPWLVAAWPGMGAVAHLAASYLVRVLGAEAVTEIPPGDHFELGKVETKEGILLPPRLPQTSLLGWRNPDGERDLVVLIGEQQPSAQTWRYCGEVLSAAAELGIVRAFTFAAMATPMRPDAVSRVFTAATDSDLLAQVRGLGAHVLREGEIGGLNGVFLAAAAQRGIPGACLLGEFPFFASGIPHPKASAAVLRTFARLAELRLDLGDIERQGEEVATQLSQHLEELERSARAGLREGPETSGEEWREPQEKEKEEDEDLSPNELEHIEELFRDVRRDRSTALELKAELDRLGVFGRYEDRFLDLFTRGE